MTYEDLKLSYVISCLVLGLIISSPTLGMVVKFPRGESFSELWILGPNRMAEDYPFNVSANEVYSVYLGVGNHMGSSAYYVVYVKFRSQLEPLPNITTGTPSPLPALSEYRVILEDGKTWEAPLEFSFSEVSFIENQCLVANCVVNDVASRVDTTALWDAENNGYYYQVFVELWIYNLASKGLQFHNRFASIWLNMTG